MPVVDTLTETETLWESVILFGWRTGGHPPDPEQDEVFHVPQARTYCAGNYSGIVSLSVVGPWAGCQHEHPAGLHMVS